MRFTGAQCSLCKKEFNENDDVVVCPICGSPHHRACWNEQGKCANEGLHKDNFQWKMPADLLKERMPEKQEREVPQELQNFQFKNGENAVQCPHCGAVNYGNDQFCMKCRKPLHTDAQNSRPEENTNPSQEDFSRYQESLRRFGGLSPESKIDDIPVFEISDYVGGKNPGRIIRKFSAMERYGKSISFTIPAFFFGPVWFFYRKMIKEGLIYTLVLLIMTFSGAALFASTKPAQTYYSGMYDAYMEFAQGETDFEGFSENAAEIEEKLYSTVYVGNDKIKNTAGIILDYSVLILRLVVSMYAMKLYKKKMKKDILKIRTQCSDYPTYERKLTEKGGTSAGYAAAGCVLLFIAQTISFIPYAIIMFK